MDPLSRATFGKQGNVRQAGQRSVSKAAVWGDETAKERGEQESEPHLTLSNHGLIQTTVSEISLGILGIVRLV